MKSKDYSIPLDELVENDMNIYEMTNASIKRSEQLSLTKADEIAKNKAKVTSMAIREIVSGKVKYKYSE
ncbi:MAG: DNA-directed RNA polymerase subunit omega [Spirochaetaceae bacterium]|jgi:DNA-directed RNA polymerase omega subunit|nr:DNA-directed RNA polymerase subunit omega [Spirochaetaceae bacterium]